MPATNRYMNFGVFSFSSTPITGISDFSFDPGVSFKKEGADADPGPTFGVVDFIDPMFSFTTYDAMALQSSIGARGIFIATILDAYNKATTGGGAKIFTTNALSVLRGAATTMRYREFGTRAFTVETLWSDASTPPYGTSAV